MKNYLDIHIKVALNIANLIVSIFILYLSDLYFVFVRIFTPGEEAHLPRWRRIPRGRRALGTNTAYK